MHPIFVLEGADNTGKSTLAQSIVNQFGAHYIHCAYSVNVVGNMCTYHLDIMDAAYSLAKFFPVVIDRWRSSEEVYATVYREGRIEGGQDATNMQINYADGLGCTFVFCHPEDKAKYLATFDAEKHKRKEMYLEGMEKVYDKYDQHILWIEKFLPETNIIIYDRFEIENVDDYAMLLVRDAYDGLYNDLTDGDEE